MFHVSLPISYVAVLALLHSSICAYRSLCFSFSLSCFVLLLPSGHELAQNAASAVASAVHDIPAVPSIESASPLASSASSLSSSAACGAQKVSSMAVSGAASLASNVPSSQRVAEVAGRGLAAGE